MLRHIRKQSTIGRWLLLMYHRSVADTSGRLDMQDKRYKIRPETDGSWTVVDTLTGLPAASDGRDLMKLARDDAQDIADVLNEDGACNGKSPLV
ncbi:hypothetical protein [Pararhizobium arenae]|uniref:hypothetical protein n=1 Tax=Pararhizobium arenae TaxID=1856850 RepID=UPI001FD9E7BC|nr:hypothetical protein [Pararhizobium arenae]